MKNRNYILGAWLLIFALLAQSCEKLLDTDSPQDLDSSKALTTKAGINAAVIGLYDYLQSTRMYGRDLFAIPEALADNGRATGNSGRFNNEAVNLPNVHMVNWQTSYFLINQANLILDNVEKSGGVLSPAEIANVQAECLFLRALTYFDLIKTFAYIPSNKTAPASQDFGGVPLILTGVDDQAKIITPARASTLDVYIQIYKDLDAAIAKFTSLPSLGGSVNGRGRAYANRPAAQALYSRVALYSGDYALSAQYANAAIASGFGTLSTNISYLADWRQKSHPEAFFDLNFDQITESQGPNESMQTAYTTLSTPGVRSVTQGFGDLVPTASMLSALGITLAGTTVTRGADVRALVYELGTSGRGVANVECTKFIGKNGPNQDNIPVLRLSEQFLNRSEAYFNLGKRDSAILSLNTIRVRAGLPAVSDTSAIVVGNNLLEEILLQRRIELAFEGHRFWDLKRLGRGITKPAPAANLPATDYRFLANIPLRELSANPNLKQNFGY